MTRKPKAAPVAMSCGAVHVRFRLTEESAEQRRADIRQAAAALRYLADQVTMWGQLHEGPADPTDPLTKVSREIEVIAEAVNAVTEVVEDLPFGAVPHVVAIHDAVAAARKAMAS